MVLLVPVGVKAGALGQTRGGDADGTEVKDKSMTSMYHSQLIGSFQSFTYINAPNG